MSGLFSRKTPAVPVRGIHLDLKGLPPTPTRLLEILDLLAAMKINCVLVEWEDTYPWTVDKSFRCKTAYSDAVVLRFLDRADALGIEVVPLIQSFGHLETVLGKKKYAGLRELRNEVSGDICPSHPKAVELIAAMVDDILRLHKGRIRRLHLGGDEVWSLGRCPKCAAFMESQGKAALYLKHIEPLLEQVNANGIRPILWDDMMRGWTLPELRKLAKQSDLMPWSYGAEPWGFLKQDVMDKFQKAGVTLWAGSAFKGADGAVADVPRLDSRAANNLVWVKEAKKRRLAGMVSTGWSRYNTYCAPCEALEASLDSLVLCAAAMWDGKLPKDASAAADAFLRCGKMKTLAGDSFFACREAARTVAEWREALPRFIQIAQECPWVIEGERDRIHMGHITRHPKQWKEYLQHGEAALTAWKKAQAGRVPPVWLKNYAASRLWMPQRIFDSIEANYNVKA